MFLVSDSFIEDFAIKCRNIFFSCSQRTVRDDRKKVFVCYFMHFPNKGTSLHELLSLSDNEQNGNHIFL